MSHFVVGITHVEMNVVDTGQKVTKIPTRTLWKKTNDNNHDTSFDTEINQIKFTYSYHDIITEAWSGSDKAATEVSEKIVNSRSISHKRGGSVRKFHDEFLYKIYAENYDWKKKHVLTFKIRLDICCWCKMRCSGSQLCSTRSSIYQCRNLAEIVQ